MSIKGPMTLCLGQTSLPVVIRLTKALDAAVGGIVWCQGRAISMYVLGDTVVKNVSARLPRYYCLLSCSCLRLKKCARLGHSWQKLCELEFKKKSDMRLWSLKGTLRPKTLTVPSIPIHSVPWNDFLYPGGGQRHSGLSSSFFLALAVGGRRCVVNSS